MGLRHRTPISALREQRRSADRQAEAAPADLIQRKITKPRRPAATDEQHPGAPIPAESSSLENDLALILRLRSRLAPSRMLEEGTRNACQALEDEIRRLGQLQAAATAPRVLPEDFHVEPSLYPHPEQEDLPYRTLKIVPPPVNKKPVLQRLDLPPRDLSPYQPFQSAGRDSGAGDIQAGDSKGETEQRRPELGKGLSLVSLVQGPPQLEEGQTDSQSETRPSEAAAAFIHQILKPAVSTDESQRLPLKLVLSLLDT